MDIVDKEGNCR